MARAGNGRSARRDMPVLRAALALAAAALLAGAPDSSIAAEAFWRIVPGGAPAMNQAAAAMDTRRHVLLAYGGQLGLSVGHGLLAFDPLTETWNPLPLAGEAPPALSGASAAYDSTGDRLLLIGSDADSPTAPLGCWAVELRAQPFLHRLEAGGEAPTARRAHVAIFDPDQRRILVHGGYLMNASGDLSGDLHQLSLEPRPSWTRLEGGGYVPPPVADHAGIYDPVDSSFVIWGGESARAIADGAEDANAGTAGTAPARRLRFNKFGPLWEYLDLPGPGESRGARAVFDAAHRAMVVVGSMSPGSWSLALGDPPGWTPHAGAPWAGYAVALGADPGRELLLAHGAQGTWKAPLGSLDSAWVSIAGATRGPMGLSMHVGFFDPMAGAVLLFGGWSGGVRNDVWKFTETPGWTVLDPGPGTPPPGRYFPTWAYVPSRDALWMFGGQSQQAALGDCYELPLRSGTGWRRISSCGLYPSARTGPAMVYSPASDALLLFGGSTDMAGSTPDSAAYLMRPANGDPCWSRNASRGPSGRFLHTLVFDSRRNRALCFGGIGADDRCWAFSFGSNTWSVVTPDGPGPGRRWKHVAAYDETGDRMLVFGGDGGSTTRELWALEFSPVVRWRKLETNGDVTTLVEGAGGFDPTVGRLFTHGGQYSGFHECRLARAGELAVEAGRAGPGFVRVLGNPSSGAWRLEVGGDPGERVHAELYDVGGRRLASSEQRAAPDGRARLTLDAGRECPPGLYFARVVSGARSGTVRLARWN